MPKLRFVTQVSKLGAAKRVPLSRIWIEGKRLVDAGFTVGRYFGKDWPQEVAGGPQVLVLTLLKPNDVLATAPCKVSGKGDKPIIDITGEGVRDTFGVICTHVEVTFEKGKITIRPGSNAPAPRAG